MQNNHNKDFYIIKDRRGNDVLYINNKNMIYTNLKETNFDYQILMYYKYLNKGIINIYNINKDLFLMKQELKNNIYWYLNNKEKQTQICKLDINDKDCGIYFNDYYLALASLENVAGIDEFIFAYDIEKDKEIDLTDYETEYNIYKYLVEIRGCTKENLLNIFDNKIYNKEMIYNFMSFIFDKNVDKENCYKYLEDLKRYIIKTYKNINDWNDLNTLYYFHRKDKKIGNLKYKKEKTYIIKK